MLTLRCPSAGFTSSLACRLQSKPAAYARVTRPAVLGVLASSISGSCGTLRSLARKLPKEHYGQATVVRASAGDDLSPADPETLELKKSAGFLRTLSFISFWSQLALSIVSGLILFFSVAVSKQGDLISQWSGLIGVVLGLLSTFFAHGFNTIAKKLSRDEQVSRGWIVNSLITNNTLNLFGIFSAIIGLQASIGNLVAKSLMTPNGFAYPPVPGSTLASLDIFALQALGNILLSHFISLAFTNLLLRSINKPAVQSA